MNIHSTPEHFGVTLLGEVEWDNWCYSFDVTAVWRGADGTLYWGDDGGCSCQSPFEDDALEDLTSGTWGELQEHLSQRLSTARDKNSATGEVAELMLRVTGEG